MNKAEIRLYTITHGSPYNVVYFNGVNTYSVDSIHVYRPKTSLEKDYIKDIVILNARSLSRVSDIETLHLNIDPSDKRIYRYKDILYIPEDLADIKVIKEEVFFDDEQDNFVYFSTFKMGIIEEDITFYNVIHSPELERLKQSISDMLRIVSEDTRSIRSPYKQSILEIVKEEKKTLESLSKKYSEMKEEDLIFLIRKDFEETENVDFYTWISIQM